MNKNMFFVYIWGAGYYAQQVLEELDYSCVTIMGIFDHDKHKQGKEFFSSIPIISPSELHEKDFDYLVISAKNYNSIEKECVEKGIASDKIITYWKEKSDAPIFVRRSERIEKLIKEKEILQYRLESAPYEWGIRKVPNIIEGAKLLEKIISDHSSLCRFGDGEFEIIREKERPWFQKPDHVLSERLKEVLFSNDNLINIAIAQNFVGLDLYKENDADAIREYMSGDTRDAIMRMLNENKEYYNAYVTRPYIIYKDRGNADRIFPLFKRIWKGRNICIVEGKYSRIGIGNDLMESTCSVRRILCPSKNAWEKYEIILNLILEKIPKESLICISLGPCATVLAYDLAKRGYQALDIGQLDNEYEWYLRDAKKRVAIPGKMVAEVSEYEFQKNFDNEEYCSQIIAIID